MKEKKRGISQQKMYIVYLLFFFFCLYITKMDGNLLKASPSSLETNIVPDHFLGRHLVNIDFLRSVCITNGELSVQFQVVFGRGLVLLQQEVLFSCDVNSNSPFSTERFLYILQFYKGCYGE